MVVNQCLQNSKLWYLVKTLEKKRGHKITLTLEQRTALCLYVSGKPFNKSVIREFIG